MQVARTQDCRARAPAALPGAAPYRSCDMAAPIEKLAHHSNDMYCSLSSASTLASGAWPGSRRALSRVFGKLLISLLAAGLEMASGAAAARLVP